MSGNQLKELPLSLKSMDRLEELKACHNQLQELSEAVLGTELKGLFVTHNCLESLPSSLVSCCLKLEALCLSHNYLGEDSVVDLTSNWTLQLKQLRRLDVYPQQELLATGTEPTTTVES